MAGQKFTLTFDAQMNVNQMKGALNQIQSSLNGLHLPQNITKELQDTFNKLSKEVQNFEVLTNKDLTGKMDTRKIENSANKISSLFKTLQIQVKDLGSLSGKSLEKLFPANAIKSITAGENAIKNYGETVKQIESTLTKATKKVQEWQDRLAGRTAQRDNQAQVVEDLKAQAKSVSELASAQGIKQSISDYKELEAAIKQAKQDIENYNNAVANGDRKANQITAKGLQNTLAKLEATKNAYDQQANAIKIAETVLKSYDNAVKGAEQKVAEFQATLDRLNQSAGQDKAQALTKLFQDLNNAGFDTSKYKQDLEGAKQAVDDFKQAIASGLIQSVQAASDVVNNNSGVIEKNTQDVRENSAAQEQLNARMRDVSALKSRIQYFFGLTNTINLFRQAVRGAYETIKELDKAMTETAVVTDFSVGDMWKQLPEYTKRANELGVTTKAAYEAATLYYQQGLTTQEVNELSVETLKMARIAGLDAAEATDRMTNALRGFNMELNAVNAQRVDDVYSRLAAISASNVDEISTAMTKVASLAHNAGMEFETTAAFLAQIIETTRESAETAGTALKTVVARFTEVKKLVNEGELKGQDEEGELIDVNKVSAALRTAGIDLNRYFLGEVGIDDIFMELAEKWDSLTSLQQRYIATQAAGSRQQSRFIALLSDYARTQELVGEAYNANGAAAKQFEKTQESLESKLARLKNAWNEFLMGLTNSTVVKAGVDLLTTLLNIVNKVTSAFGEGVGSVLKWTAAIAALRGISSFVSSGGGLEKLISLMTSGRGLIGGVGAGTASAAGRATLESTLWAGAQSLNSTVGAALTGMAPAAGVGVGILGIATALGTVTAAIGGLALAYKAWLKFSPEGQLKTLQKTAKGMEEDAQAAEKSSKAISDLKERYNNYTEAVNNATTVTERQTAIQARNDAILNAIDENPDYAQYLDTNVDKVSGELVLTLNEGKVTEAAVQAAKDATDTVIKSYFAQAEVALKQAEIQANKQKPKYTGNENGFLGARIKIGEGDTSATTEVLRQNYLAAAQSQVKLAYASMIKGFDFDLGSTLANDFASVLSSIFMETQEALDSVTVESIARGFKNGEFNVDLISSLVADNLDVSLSDLNLKNGVEPFLEIINVTTDELSNLAKALGVEESVIRKLLIQRAAEIKEVQKNNRAKVYTDLLQNGVGINKVMREFIETLSPRNVEQALDLLTNSEGLLDKASAKELRSNLPKMDISEMQELSGLFKSIDLENPIAAFSKLNEIIANGSPLLQKYASRIKAANKEVLNPGNVFQSMFYSDDYEDVDKAITKLLKKNDQLSTENVEELIDEFDILQKYIDEDVVSVRSLTKALNAVNKGAPINGLTDTVLEAWDAVADLDDLIYDLHDHIANFNAGIDYGEGTDFIVEQTDALLELIDNYEFGNEQFKNIWIELFGKESYESIMSQYATASKAEFHNIVAAAVNELKTFASEEGYEFMEAAAAGRFSNISGVTKSTSYDANGDEIIEFNWDIGTDTTEQVRQKIMDALSVSETTAMGILEGVIAHMGDLAAELKVNDYNAAIQAIVDQTEGSVEITRAELEALAQSYGKSIEDVAADLDTVSTQSGKTFEKPITIDWTDASGQPLTSEALQKQFNAQVGIDAALQNAIDEKSGTIDADKLLDNLKNMGLSDIQAEQIADSIVDTLTNAIDTSLSADGTIDTDKFIEALIGDGVSQDLADQWAQNLTDNITKGLLSRPITIQKVEFDPATQDLTVTPKVEYVYANSLDALESDTTEKLQAAIEAVNYDKVGQALAAQNYDEVERLLNEAISSGAETGVTNAQETIDSLSFASTEANAGAAITNGVITGYVEAQNWLNQNPLTVSVNEVNIPNIHALGAGAGGGTTVDSNGFSGRSGTFAKGGYIRSMAQGSGSSFLQPGWALTGEEGPEVIWNKDFGYAYITGTKGPEFQNLNPGDRIFNAQETSRILRNTSFAQGGYYDSYASGGWNRSKIIKRRGGNDNNSSGSSDSSSNDTPTIWENELDWLYNLLEDITELERQQEKLAEKHERYLNDISKTGRDLYETSKAQLDNLETQRSNEIERLQRRRQEMGEQIGISGYGNYVWWNDKDQTLEIDWDAIEAIQDKDTYDEITDLISRLEKIQDEMDEAQDALWDIEGQIKEIEQRYLQEFTQYQQRVYDAVVKTYQDSIDNLSDLNDTLNDTNSRILDSISKEIELERQIRDNTDTENTIADMEARLAYLRRDTTGANQAEIRDLEKQIEDARENYSDTLIDQQLDRLSEANEQAAEQREQQIALMTAQLEYWQETGALWTEVAELMESGIDDNGIIIRGSDLEMILRNADGWKAMSEQQREVWGNELITSTNQAGAYLLKISEGLEGISAGVWAMIPSSSVTSQKLQYATGGLNRATGWAWLDGTANEPEYVLNARQTDAFLRLAEILPSMFNGSSITNNNLGGNVYVELTMNVSNISSDYDVDNMMDRVKQNIYDAASYRNVNAVNFQR